MSRMRAFMMVLAAAAVAVPMSARAQGNAPTADQLQARAEALHSSPELWVVAANLYKRSAALRTPGDPQAVQSLAMAARLFTYAGQYGRGRSTMENAAEQAVKDGDVVTAGKLFAEAAFISSGFAHDNRAADLVERVVWLAAAPGLTPGQRDEMIKRLGNTVTASVAAAGGTTTLQ